LTDRAEATETRFEDLLASLEKTIAQLADGTAPLEELVAAHQRAVSLLVEAQGRLDAIKARAEHVTRQLTE
jgi:exodeoxyribonuclease VII small subunit